MSRGSRAVTRSARPRTTAETKAMKKQALRPAPMLTNVYTGLFIFLPTSSYGKKKVKFKSIITKTNAH